MQSLAKLFTVKTFGTGLTVVVIMFLGGIVVASS